MQLWYTSEIKICTNTITCTRIYLFPTILGYQYTNVQRYVYQQHMSTNHARNLVDLPLVNMDVFGIQLIYLKQ